MLVLSSDELYSVCVYIVSRVPRGYELATTKRSHCGNFDSLLEVMPSLMTPRLPRNPARCHPEISKVAISSAAPIRGKCSHRIAYQLDVQLRFAPFDDYLPFAVTVVPLFAPRSDSHFRWLVRFNVASDNAYPIHSSLGRYLFFLPYTRSPTLTALAITRHCPCVCAHP